MGGAEANWRFRFVTFVSITGMEHLIYTISTWFRENIEMLGSVVGFIISYAWIQNVYFAKGEILFHLECDRCRLNAISYSK